MLGWKVMFIFFKQKKAGEKTPVRGKLSGGNDCQSFEDWQS
jgi:hypothetical protein